MTCDMENGDELQVITSYNMEKFFTIMIIALCIFFKINHAPKNIIRQLIN